MKNAVWTDNTIKTIWEWASKWYISKDDVWANHFEISDFEDYNLLEIVLCMDTGHDQLVEYLQYNDHSNYRLTEGYTDDCFNMEELEEKVDNISWSNTGRKSIRLYEDAIAEPSENRNSFSSKLTYLSYLCMEEQMGRGRTPVHPLEIFVMRKVAWYLGVIQGGSGENNKINAKELDDASGDFYERFGLL